MLHRVSEQRLNWLVERALDVASLYLAHAFVQGLPGCHVGVVGTYQSHRPAGFVVLESIPTYVAKGVLGTYATGHGRSPCSESQDHSDHAGSHSP